MPGMMDTCLNIGLNPAVIAGLVSEQGAANERFVWDSYRRLMQMFGDIVLGVPHSAFEDALDALKHAKGVKHDIELGAPELQQLVATYEGLILAKTGRPFPTEPQTQLRMAIDAVFNSWNNARARAYRDIHGLPHSMGTAVNVQAMVFGNRNGSRSATGVAFTRNPATGERAYYGEFLTNAQGEDVVAGIRTPEPLSALEATMPAQYAELCGVFATLERHFREMQDVEFTIEDGVLYMLQCRTGKRTAAAAVAIAADMADEGLITREEAVARVACGDIDMLLHKQIDPAARKLHTPIARGLPASPGAAVGTVVFDAASVVRINQRNSEKKEGEKKMGAIMIRLETSAEDVIGMHGAEGILTARGGMTSHAAVVCRGMNKCCVSGCGAVRVAAEGATSAEIGGHTVREGDILTLDGATGEVYLGAIPLSNPSVSGAFSRILEWADGIKRMEVHANANTPEDARVSHEFGAQGCGLARTERMFFDGARIVHMRQMILAETPEGRAAALARLLPYQRADFVQLLREFAGLPVIIRLLDPPLHEFLPREPAAIASVAAEVGVSEEQVRAKVAALSEMNPMLGFRGVRVGIVYPEITAMQARAIFEAALQVQQEATSSTDDNKKKKVPLPKIEVPLAGHVNELKIMKEIVCRVAKETGADGVIQWRFGAMIETPRACVTADELARECDFFSFGTNDLTQTTCGFSRDDAGKFLPQYLEKKIYASDPFQSLDVEGVGALIAMAVQKARSTKPNIEIGICGEVGGDPASIEFFDRVGLDNVSCSAYRVPVARLAAAQATLKNKNNSNSNSNKK
jgi:pyruvate,orthophosphate dikinase